ncbi:NADP-dependent oxidoreductase [Protaetiibacter sp. SSC-01]|uniref:NADP-dependent oxidoreductase n=1 Tax=Protaetiibacter sp. SSC-01 TaxID=2759943 RepID=UPI001656E41A|nr:NADP-dependent oxidoreductase [Protaetiibacter sp. SSC-01]QNO36899.1 NADP-dependent oxidoreductase [Protaetiibacter sp. SSC-01]
MITARYARYGGPEVVELVELPRPEPGPGEYLVELRAAGLNPADVKVRRGATPVAPLPSGIGREFAGVVVAVGEGAARYRVGDEVIGTGEWVIGEYATAPEELLAAKPAELPWTWAASIPVAIQTAAVAVASQDPRPGDTVLVSAAAGGVGFFASQLAVRTGARVIGTASERNHALLRELGVEPIVYGDGLEERLRALAPEGIDIVLDHQGRETIETALALGVARDRINTISGYDGWYAVRYVGRKGMNRELVERLASELVDGTLRMRIEAEYPLARIRDGYRHLESGHLAGKVVLTI